MAITAGGAWHGRADASPCRGLARDPRPLCAAYHRWLRHMLLANFRRCGTVSFSHLPCAEQRPRLDTDAGRSCVGASSRMRFLRGPLPCGDGFRAVHGCPGKRLRHFDGGGTGAIHCSCCRALFCWRATAWSSCFGLKREERCRSFERTLLIRPAYKFESGLLPSARMNAADRAWLPRAG